MLLKGGTVRGTFPVLLWAIGYTHVVNFFN